jgi:tetratricopeptide (TPR) repeat protein
MESESEKNLHQGIQLAEAGDFDTALIYLNRAAKLHNSAVAESYRAYCLAWSKGYLKAAAKDCQNAMTRDRSNPIHYLILGRILLLAGNRTKAIRTFRLGLKAAPNPLIIEELKQLGLRKPAVISSLERDHVLNRLLGKILAALRLR